MSDTYDFSSGIPSLDMTLQGVWAGDNIVYQVESLQEFLPFARRFCLDAHQKGEPLVYFRFADHAPFVPDEVEADVYHLDPQQGFEQFITEIFHVIEQHGKGGYYVFDCLSGLAVDWYSDQMLGNFFRLTCPYLYTYDTVTYFALLRNLHTPLAIDAIHQTAQIVLDVFHSADQIYVLPIKVFNRHSPTMYMLHSWEDDRFLPVTRSAVMTEILSHVPQPWIDVNIDRKDTWTDMFIRAQRLADQLQQGMEPDDEIRAMKTQLIHMIVTRDAHLARLCEEYVDLSDLVAIGKRMIGTGLIGGKSVGMLLARRILAQTNHPVNQRLEQHDSFFVGSDVFYTYIIQNDCWWEKHQMKTSKDLYEYAEEIRRKLRDGRFPQEILDQFKHMLNYFGQSPIVVRSSSLLEDAYGNSFSGKYDTVFCANQGPPEQRLQEFLQAVRTVYASTVNEDALAYRLHRGLMGQEEQMALLVQRVSGQFYEQLYFPHLGGVAYSFNPFVWNPKIDPFQGVIRLVFGLGTRAVDRHDDDYTRVIALNAPLLRPEGTSQEANRYCQRVVHVLDLQKKQHVSRQFDQVMQAAADVPLTIFATRDRELERRAKQLRIKQFFSWQLNFETLLTQTSFIQDMQTILSLLQAAYDHPVDVEFTANFFDKTEYRINLVQCRPFQAANQIRTVAPPENLAPQNLIVRTGGPIVGQSRAERIDRLIVVSPERYGELNMTDRYLVARTIGKITNRRANAARKIMLIGPGRWGSTLPALGVPVSFAEIKNVSVLCEIPKMHEGLTPDLSLGTHFFNDLVEMNILYMGISPGKQNALFHEALLKSLPNRLPQLFPEDEEWAETIQVIDSADLPRDSDLFLHANSLTQEGLLFLTSP